MVIITPEARLIPASFPHQIQARTAVMTKMIATAVNKKIRGPTLMLTGEECRSFTLFGRIFMEFVLKRKRWSEDFCSRLPKRGVYLAAGSIGIQFSKRRPGRYRSGPFRERQCDNSACDECDRSRLRSEASKPAGPAQTYLAAGVHSSQCRSVSRRRLVAQRSDSPVFRIERDAKELRGP